MSDPLTSIDVPKLLGLVKETPFAMGEFENLIGWSFGLRDAPKSKRRIAWKTLKLPKEDLQRLHELQGLFPQLWISEVSNADSVLVGSGNVVPSGRAEDT